MKFKVEVHVDPPLSEVEMQQHDFVMIQAESTSLESLTWFLKLIEDRTVCSFAIEEIGDDKE